MTIKTSLTMNGVINFNIEEKTIKQHNQLNNIEELVTLISKFDSWVVQMMLDQHESAQMRDTNWENSWEIGIDHVGIAWHASLAQEGHAHWKCSKIYFSSIFWFFYHFIHFHAELFTLNMYL